MGREELQCLSSKDHGSHNWGFMSWCPGVGLVVPDAGPDTDWNEHDGYPRDMDDEEKQWRDYKARANKATRFGERNEGVILQANQVGTVATGDLVTNRNGLVRKANLGDTVMGRVDAVDPVNGHVYVVFAIQM